METETRTQSLNPLWHEYRKLRITASNIHSFLTCTKISDSLLGKLKGTQTTPEVPAVVYGITNEAIAKRKF